LGEIAELLFGPDSDERGIALARMGLDERFVARVSQVFETDQSALLALLRYEDIADRDELLRTLNLFRGQPRKQPLLRKYTRIEPPGGARYLTDRKQTPGH
jgi:hypothetical protein